MAGSGFIFNQTNSAIEMDQMGLGWTGQGKSYNMLGGQTHLLGEPSLVYSILMVFLTTKDGFAIQKKLGYSQQDFFKG